VAKDLTVDLAHYLRTKGSPLAAHVPDIYAAANKYRIDPRLIVAVSGGETSFGKAGPGPRRFNAWGIGPGRAYGSWSQGIDAAAKLLRDGYIGQGLTSLSAIQQKWAPLGAGNDPSNLNSNWTRTIGSFYSDLGGDPADVTKGWRSMASPKATSVTQPGRPRSPTLRSTTSLESPPSLDYDPVSDAAFRNLLDIARGKKATSTLESLLQATLQRTLSEAAARRTTDAPAEGTPPTPDGGTTAHTPTTEKAKDGKKQNAVRIAMQQLGKPYVWGGTTPQAGFDCSGLIEWAYEQAGIPTPGRLTTYSAMKLGRSVRGSMEPGDWLITNGGKHIVMYIGGGEVVAAPHRGTTVQVQKVSRFKGDIVDIRRYP
jgi:cell wall-associated NlpC family hydrolase